MKYFRRPTKRRTEQQVLDDLEAMQKASQQMGPRLQRVIANYRLLAELEAVESVFAKNGST